MRHCSITKMDKEQEQALAEQEALLAECKLYQGEKEPETKEPLKQEDEEETVTGLPVGPGPASTDVGVPVPPTPWSTGLFQCCGTGDEHFSSDLEVCEHLSFFTSLDLQFVWFLSVSLLHSFISLGCLTLIAIYLRMFYCALLEILNMF